jgi:hypothetical protein
MPYTMEDFEKDFVKEHFHKLNSEEQCEALRSLSAEARRAALKGLSPEERLGGLPPEDIEQFLRKPNAGPSTCWRKPRRRYMPGRGPRQLALLYQLLQQYQREGFTIPYTIEEDFSGDFIEEHFHKLTPEEQREALQSLSAEERRNVLRGLSAEERLEGLSHEEIEQFLQRQKAKRPSRKGKPRRKP